jgi:hypothetical protein
MERPKVIKDENWKWLDELHPINDYVRKLHKYIDHLESKEALTIPVVEGRSEQYFCCKDQINERCSEQCLGCFQFENKD